MVVGRAENERHSPKRNNQQTDEKRATPPIIGGESHQPPCSCCNHFTSHARGREGASLLSRAGGSADLQSAATLDVPLVGTQVLMLLPTGAHEMGLASVTAPLEKLTYLEVASVIGLAGTAVPAPALISLGAVDLLRVASERPNALDACPAVHTEQVLTADGSVIWSLAWVTPFF